ncbi:hypothetical protein Leryth_018992 [Lithospermum erythrorhizon]|nr:hypothetical protein Leryth_018992 [Lithospermum erythrorhizon]
MLLNQDHITTTNNSGATTVCGHCGVSDALLLHSIRHRGNFLRLCATCVLRLHPHSFCPTCFSTVLNYSSADVTPQCPYVCPLCNNKTPNSKIFEVKKVNELNVNCFDGFGDDMVMSVNGVVIDEKAARVLLAAATISSNSMCKAALAAKSEAERRAREAVNTRKRAKYALEHMAVVVAKEKLKMMKTREGTGMEGNAGGVMERMDSYSRDGVGNRGGGVLGGARSLEKDSVVGNLERLERCSNGVLAREINAVECREEGSGGIRPPSMVVVAPSCSNGATMDVDERWDTSLGPGLDVGDSGAEGHDGGSVGVMSSNPDQLNQSPQGNAVSNNDVVLHPPTEDQLQGVEDGHPER